MSAAEQVVRTIEPSEPLPWAEICARHPDQFVCLIDVVPVERWSPAIASGRVVGHGPNRRDAFAPIKNDLRFTSWRTVFTGSSKKPLRRPPVFFE